MIYESSVKPSAHLLCWCFLGDGWRFLSSILSLRWAGHVQKELVCTKQTAYEMKTKKPARKSLLKQHLKGSPVFELMLSPCSSPEGCVCPAGKHPHMLLQCNTVLAARLCLSSRTTPFHCSTFSHWFEWLSCQCVHKHSTTDDSRYDEPTAFRSDEHHVV